MSKRQETKEFKRLHDHLIAEHGYEADYFEDTPDTVFSLTLENLRWLHAPWVRTREFRDGCERI